MPRKAAQPAADGTEAKGEGALMILVRTTKSFAVYNEETATRVASDGAILYWPIKKFNSAGKPKRLILTVQSEEEG